MGLVLLLHSLHECFLYGCYQVVKITLQTYEFISLDYTKQNQTTSLL